MYVANRDHLGDHLGVGNPSCNNYFLYLFILDTCFPGFTSSKVLIIHKNTPSKIFFTRDRRNRECHKLDKHMNIAFQICPMLDFNPEETEDGYLANSVNFDYLQLVSE